MAYCRFLDSDIYVFSTVFDGKNCIECCACSMGEQVKGSPFRKSFFAYTTVDMLNHLVAHQDNGDYFDPKVIMEVMEDDSYNFGGDSDF